MAFKFWLVPVQESAAAEAELNAFLGNHTVLSVDRRWIDQGTTSAWCLCIEYLEPREAGGKANRVANQRSRVDYRELLSEEDFAVFARLRDLRKEIAQAEGVPVYTVFNNDQLAQLVQKRVRSKADLEAIVGVGEARVEKYGNRFLEVLAQCWKAGDEKGGKPVSGDSPPG